MQADKLMLAKEAMSRARVMHDDRQHEVVCVWPTDWTAICDLLAIAEGAEADRADAWQPIETAPKGGGATLRTDPAWVEPPSILLLFGGGEISVGYWDWYYAETGGGYIDGHAWIEPVSGELLSQHYDPPIAWKSLPQADAALAGAVTQGEG